jgi:hypothetical protein
LSWFDRNPRIATTLQTPREGWPVASAQAFKAKNRASGWSASRLTRSDGHIGSAVSEAHSFVLVLHRIGQVHTELKTLAVHTKVCAPQSGTGAKALRL